MENRTNATTKSATNVVLSFNGKISKYNDCIVFFIYSHTASEHDTQHTQIFIQTDSWYFVLFQFTFGFHFLLNSFFHFVQLLQ